MKKKVACEFSAGKGEKAITVIDRRERRKESMGRDARPAKEKRWIIEICALDVYILICFQAIQKTF